jgi:hypothetical protein
VRFFVRRQLVELYLLKQAAHSGQLRIADNTTRFIFDPERVSVAVLIAAVLPLYLRLPAARSSSNGIHRVMLAGVNLAAREDEGSTYQRT